MISGERVVERMAIRGLSQAELARRAGVSQPTIFKLIHENKSGSRVLHRVARELRTTPAYLTRETDDPTADLPDDLYSPEEREWVDLLRGIHPTERKALLVLTRSLATSARSPGVHSPQLEYRTE